MLENIKSENKILLSLERKVKTNDEKIESIATKIDILRDSIDDILEINRGYEADIATSRANIEVFVAAYATAMKISKEEAKIIAFGETVVEQEPEVAPVEASEYTGHIYPANCYQPTTNEVENVVGFAEDDE